MNLFRQQRTCPPTILRAYKDGDFTDLTIICGIFTFHVHQVVVCSACDFFKKSIKFAVGKEAEEKRIDLPEDDPEMIRRLVAYLYLGDYDPCPALRVSSFSTIRQHESTSAAASAYHSRYRATGLEGSDQCACLAPNTKNINQPVLEPESKNKPADYSVVVKMPNCIEVANPLTIHATMYALADKYQVDGLGQVAKEKFESCLHHHANSGDFVAAVQLAYGATPDSNRGLRDAVVTAFLTHFKINVKENPGIEAKLDTIDELSFLLIKSWPMKTEQPKPVNPIFNPQASLFSSTPPTTRPVVRPATGPFFLGSVRPS
ncbi:uncharacterized protein K460DRAFT_80395 [Cucurbitaria berberidis CBS 394.84]|uniref:BTB domain-containing protein n=1 Tax=Cucurbitaria berberidis CBS 394.84 TaxID=1168544 RepID=A0A9P4GLU8_9PLEO|nr:uncharacterized protein K460DRAFT_80395 [Cucurbitaria berberidis CBS 394.84]KAF1848748.1 hypothetical protein K460DRAFT_80395 [Cucurbitaria berberidis CBS 394.84]